MRKNNICPKCQSNNILKKETKKFIWGTVIPATNSASLSRKNTSKITFYICSDCGFIEEYLDAHEIEKMREFLSGDEAEYPKLF